MFTESVCASRLLWRLASGLNELGIGRTGRAGREGTAITYFTNDDAPYLKP